MRVLVAFLMMICYAAMIEKQIIVQGLKHEGKDSESRGPAGGGVRFHPGGVEISLRRPMK
jgi:hypothetical protein